MVSEQRFRIFLPDLHFIDLYWMQNQIRNRMSRVSKVSPWKNMRIWAKILVLALFCYYVQEKICSSIYDFFLVGFVRYKIKFCLEWLEFHRDHLGKICGCRPKYCVFTPVLLVCLGEICYLAFIQHLIGFVGWRI